MDSALAYEKNAHDFLHQRDQSLIGVKVISEWAKKLQTGSSIIEIACGGGNPISKVLIETGLVVWAMDSSKTLISEFQSRFPNVPTKCERVQDSNFFNKKFDAVIAIGLIFLLPENEQTSLIKKVAKIMKPNGNFLFTAPIEMGAWKDANTGIECFSLGHDKYEELLEASGLQITDTFYDEGNNNYYEVQNFKFK
ncbi:MAG: class I SAM-dependent methyltransferase [Pseudomonadota bacterium]